MLKIRCTQITRMSMSSYIGCLCNKIIIAHGIVAGNNNVIGVYTLHFEQISKRGAKAGSCTPDCMLIRMG